MNRLLVVLLLLLPWQARAEAAPDGQIGASASVEANTAGPADEAPAVQPPTQSPASTSIPVEPLTVVVISPRRNAGGTVYAAQRIGAELTASGFLVKTRRFRWNSVSAMVEDAVVAAGASAAITVTRADEGVLVDVWIADRAGGKTVGRRVLGNSPEQVGVSAVEVLRAGLLELTTVPDSESLLEEEPLLPPPEPPPEPPPSPPLSTVKEWRISSGGAVMIASESLGGAAGPQVRIAKALSTDWWVGGHLIAPLLGGENQGVPVGQAILKAELGWTYSFAESLMVVPTIGVGAYWIGRGEFQGLESDHDYAAIGSWGVGLAVDLFDDVYFLWDVNGLLFLPRPGVDTNSRALAQPGVPAFLTSFGLNFEFSASQWAD